MPSRYHITTVNTPPLFVPVAKLNAIEDDGCLGCRVCVKRSSCVYDVYKKRKFNATEITNTGDAMCISCMRCVQECKKNILSRTINPQYSGMGDDYWKPDIISSIWKQAETGKIPVSGAGYRGPFTGTGFDRMWTDMSEIVRPTRDGIHGREYISTVIELGRRPSFLEFDNNGNLTTETYPFIEIPLPVLLEIPQRNFVGDSLKKSVAKAAGVLGTFAIADFNDAQNSLTEEKKHLMVRFEPDTDDPAALKNTGLIEVAYRENIIEIIKKIKAANPEIIVSIRVPLDEHAKERVGILAVNGAEIINLEANHKGNGKGKLKNKFIIDLVKEIHFELLGRSLRDQVTVLITGGIAMAEHVAKIIACGADGVIADLALLAAVECRLCPDCMELTGCPVKINKLPVDYGTRRIVNLIGSWHSQLVEIMGAMGLREVRRLRGELGRTMFFENLEKEIMSPLFGERKYSLEDSLKTPMAKQNEIPEPNHSFSSLVSSAPSRYRNSMGKFKVVRTSDCISCGKCAEVCQYGVFKKAGSRMLAPRSHLCVGSDVCSNTGSFCVTHCPQDAIRIGPNPQWETFGDPRWPAELLAGTWKQAETGYPPKHDMEHRTGASGGGFDKIKITFPKIPANTNFKPEDVDLSVPINRRKDDNRPNITIDIPFYGGGMSYGSISLDTMLARARAYSAFNSFTCTGEGGYPEELKKYAGNVITQIATGLFGVREETIQRAKIVEFKYAQGAKPGLGGHLLGDKNTPAVAKMREAVQGFPLFSPFPFHSVYSIEDHKKHIDWIKEINPKALISTKVSGASDVDMVAVGSYYAGTHIIHIDGSYGGTGASPDIAKKNIAMPVEYAVPKVHRFLIDEGIRDEITVIGSGGIRSAWDVAKTIALGADGVVIGTAEVVALECIRCGACESGRGCPRGIATTDPELSMLLKQDWATQRLINLFHSWVIQLQDILWRLGMKSIRELVGRADMLEHLDYERTRNE